MFANLFDKKKQKKDTVSLKASVDIESKINEVYATTKVTQKIHNTTNKPVEIEVYIYKNLDNIIFSSFYAKVGNSVEVKSKVIKTEKAEEKYTDSVSSGNAAIYASIDKYDKNKIIVHIGNIPPNEELIFTSEFIQFTESSNNSNEYELFRNLPKLDGPEAVINYENINGTVEIQTKNKIINIDKKLLSNTITVLEEKNDEKNNKFFLKYKYSQLNIEYISSNKICFKLETNSQPKIFSQNSQKNKEEESFILNYTLTPKKDEKNLQKDKKNQKKEDIKLSPALFIFLIDQSGSMAGSPIKVASKALLLFLQSLPAGSYYQLIGFGNKYKVYDSVPKQYNQKNILASIKTVEGLKGNMGGTNIYAPLNHIYNSKKDYNKISLPRNIFLLTDGEIDNKKDTLNLIEKNSNDFSVYAFGMGNSFDEDLIKNAGTVGKGSYSFCKEINGLNQVIASTLNTICVPSIKGFKLTSSIDKLNLYQMNEINEIIIQNKIYRFYYIIKEKLDNKKINIKAEYEYKEKKNTDNYEITPIELPIGDELSKLIVYNYISNQKNLSNEEKIKLALKYQIFIEGTSLFAEVELDKKTVDEMEHKEIIRETNNNQKNKNISLNLDDKCKEFDEKIQNLENQANNLKNEAKMKLMNGDKEGARRIMVKHKKMIDEMKQNEAALNMLEEQKLMLDSQSSSGAMDMFKCASNAVKDATCAMGVEDIECMKDNMEIIESNQSEKNELNDFFKEYGDYDEMDAMDAIDELENEIENEKNSANYEFNGNIFNEQDKHQKKEEEDLAMFLSEDSNIKQEQEIKKEKSPEKIVKKEEKILKLDKDGVMKIINTQNFIEGFWDINNSTKIIKTKYQKEFDVLKKLKDIKINDNIAMTIIIIYFINKEHQELLEELVMIIKKAKLYIQDKAGDSYDNIIKKAGL